MTADAEVQKPRKVIRLLCHRLEVIQMGELSWDGAERAFGTNVYWFRRKSWEKALRHLAECERCRELSGMSLTDVQEELERIERVRSALSGSSRRESQNGNSPPVRVMVG